jgi:hypothetical protein
LCLQHDVAADILYSQDVITHSNKFCPYVSHQLLLEWSRKAWYLARILIERHHNVSPFQVLFNGDVKGYDYWVRSVGGKILTGYGALVEDTDRIRSVGGKILTRYGALVERY